MSKFAWKDGKDHYADPNPYYEPEACGLEIVCSLEDANANYSFDTVVLWRDPVTGAFYAAHDAGCSCPTPFENINSVDDMTPIRSLNDLKEFVDKHNQYVRWYTAEFYDTANAAICGAPQVGK